MLETSARLLRVLSLLQSRRDWTGAELAARLDVGLRTVRRDIDRLRDLGYPVDATPGVAGGYRLGVGAGLPPLLLDDEEAVAVAISLHTATTGSVAGLEESSLRALTKLQQTLPSRLRHRISAFHATTVPLAGPGPDRVDPDLLTAVAAACRDQRRLRLWYPGREGVSIRDVEPHRLVHTPRRWYLLAWDTGRGDWRTFRVDRIRPPLGPPGARFTPRTMPADDVAAYVSQAISSAPYRYQARLLIHAAAAAVARRTSPAAGRLEALDEHSCVLHTGSNSLEELALYVAVKGFDFEVLDPPGLVPVLRALSERLGRAARASPAGVSLLAGPDGVAQAEKGPDIGHESAQVLVGSPEPVLDAVQPGPFGQPLLVERPFARGRQTALGRRQHCLAQVRQAGDRVLTAGVDLGEVQRARGEPEPGGRRGLPQLPREPGARQVTGQHPAKSQFPGQNVGGDPGLVADLSLDLELPLPGGRGPVQDLVQVAVNKVNLGAIDRQPGPAVHDAAPLAGSEDPARPAERHDPRRVQRAPVVQAEVPVGALGRRIRRPRPSESHRHDPGDRGQLGSKMLHGPSIPQPFSGPATPLRVMR